MVEIKQEIQQKILAKLIHNPGLSFNEIWDKNGESNLFNYHLQVLINLNFIVKTENGYFLTNEGKTYISAIDGETAKVKPRPIVCSFIIGFKKETDEILINIRKKEPFYDYVGIPGGKIDFGSSPMDSAKKEFMEETGLEGDLRLVGISNYNTYEGKHDIIDRVPMHHVIAFTYVSENCTGSFIETTREGENLWIPRSSLRNYSHYPEIAHFIDSVLSSNEIKYFNIDRFQKEGKFLKEFNELSYF